MSYPARVEGLVNRIIIIIIIIINIINIIIIIIVIIINYSFPNFSNLR